MNEQQKPKSKKISQWLEDVHVGKIAKPRWQRGFVWDLARIESLLKSIAKKQPVGTLLTLQHIPTRPTFSPIPLHFAKIEEKAYVEQLILDGQQRVSAIWLAISDKHPDATFYFKVKIESYSSLVNIEDVCSFKKNGKASPINSQHEHELGLVPLRLLDVRQNSTGDDITKWCKEIHPNHTESYIQLSEAVRELRREFLYEEIYYFELDNSIDYDRAIDIFVETNKAPRIVSTFDIAVARFDSEEQEGMRELLENINLPSDQKTRFFGEEGEKHLADLGDTVLKVACLLNKNGPRPPTAGNIEKVETIELLKTHWENVVYGIRSTLDYLEEQSIWDRKRLPRDIPLRVLPALFSKFRMEFENLKPDVNFEVRNLIKTWLWRSLLTRRYDRQANTRLFEDYKELVEDVKGIIERSGEIFVSSNAFGGDVIDWEIDSIQDPLPPPTSQSALSKAVFCVTLRRSPCDIVSGAPVTIKNIGSKEYHHLFPKSKRALLKDRHGNVDKLKAINHPLNFALVERGSNAKFGNKHPREYLEEQTISGKKSVVQMRKFLSEMYIPYDFLNVDVAFRTYDKFIRERGSLVRDEIDALLSGVV